MANTDTTDTTTQPAADPNAVLSAALQYLMGQRQQAAAPPAPVDRSVASLLGEAVGGGTTGLAPADRESAGTRALLNFGLNMLSASGPSTMPRSFGQVFAQGAGGAEQSLAGSEAVGASRLAAQQAYEEKQQELTISRIKEAIPLLTLQTQMKQAAAARGIAGVGAPPAAPPGADGTYEGSVGALEGSGKSATSTAAGYGQFIEPTWQAFTAANPDLFKGMTPEQVLAARDDPAIARQAVTWLAQQNAPVLSKAGIAPNGQSLALAHTLGPVAAAAVMQAPDNRPLVDVLSASIGKDQAAAYVKANPTMANATAGSYRQKYASVPAPDFLNPGAGAKAPAPYKVASTAPTASPVATATAAAPAPETAPTLDAAAARAAATGKPVLTTDPAQPPGTTAMPDGTVKLVPPAVAAPTPTTPPPPPTDLAHFVPVPGPLPADEAYNPNLSPDDVSSFQKQRQLAAQLAPEQQAAALAKIEADERAAVLAKRNAAADATTKYRAAETQRQFDVAKQIATQQATLELERAKSGFNVDAANAEATFKGDQDRLNKMTAAADTARDTQINLEQVRSLLPTLPTSGWTSALMQHLGPTAVQWLRNIGISDPSQATSYQLLEGIRSYLGVQMRPTGSGSLREAEMNRFSDALPGLAETPDGRAKALAFMLNYADRTQREADFAQEYRQRPNANGQPINNLLGLQRAMDKPRDQGGLGEVVPHAPPLNVAPTAAAQQSWLTGTDKAGNPNVEHGRPYYAWVPVIDPKTARPVLDANGKPTLKYDLAVRP